MANYEKQRQPIFPTWLLWCKSDPRIDSLHLTDNCGSQLLQRNGRGRQWPQCVKVVEKAPVPTASTVDNEEEDLFLSEGEYRVVSCRKLCIKWLIPSAVIDHAISGIAGRDIHWTPSTFSDAPYYVVWGISTYQDVCVSFCAVTCRDLDKWIFVNNNKKILNYLKSIVICPQSISPRNLHTRKLNNFKK